MTTEEPYVASHTPKRLEKLSAECLSANMLKLGLSKQFTSLILFPENAPQFLQRNNVDQIIVADEKSSEELKLLKRELKSQLKKVKLWWDQNEVFGLSQSLVRRLISEAMENIFDQMDGYFKSPIFIFTLQLCFSRQAGYFNKPFVEMSLELPKQSCPNYAEFIEDLKPFGIREMVDTSIRFGNPEPLAVILRNAPELRNLHLRNNGSDFILDIVGTSCPRIERLIVEGLFGLLMVSEEYIFRAFFKGLKKEKVLSYVNNRENIPKSFASLKFLDVGKSNEVLEFLYYIQYFYKNIRTISCNGMNIPPEITLMKMPPDLLEQNFTFHVVDLALTSLSLMTVDIDNVIAMFPYARHITLSIDMLPVEKWKLAIDKSINIIKTLKIFSLTIHIQYDSENDEVLFELYSEILKGIGAKISALQFHIIRPVDWKLILSLVNFCPNLELLGLNIAIDTTISEKLNFSYSVKPLKKLRKMSVCYEEMQSLCSFLKYIENIITISGKLEKLELFLPHTACNWLVTVAMNGHFCSVKYLVLGLQYATTTSQPDLDFYVPVVEALPSLETLVLVKVPDVVVCELKRVFKTSALEIRSACRSSVGYIGLHSSYKF